MEQLDNVFRCSCCNELSEDWREFDTSVTLAGKAVLVREMIDIFKLPQGWCIKTDDGICLTCLERLEYCYQFYATLLNTTTNESDFSIELLTPAGDDTIVQCSFCDVLFTTKLDLEKHLKIHHPQPKLHFYYCQTCKKSFKTRGMLQHGAIYHDAHETYCCNICDRQFNTKTNYLNHMRYHKDYVCSFCNSGWIGELNLQEHVRTTHTDRLFVCRFCNRKERLKKCLNRHLRKAHHQQSYPYFCGHCGHDNYFYETYEMLMDHLQKHHHENDGSVREKDSYATQLHDSLFAKELELQDLDGIVKEQEQFLQNFSLIRSEHEKKEFARPLEPRIDQRMVLEGFLDEALEDDEIWNKYLGNGEEYLIDDCDLYLKGIEGTTEQEYMYKCPQCQRGFQKQNHLTVHLAEDHNVSSLVCSECEICFSRLSEYRTHRREHLKENVRFRESNIPEVEELIQSTLSLEQSTSQDYSVHEEDSGYIFTCKLCDRTFQRKHNLEKHKCRFYERHQQHQPPAVVGGGNEVSELKHCTCCHFQTTSSSEMDAHQRTHRSNIGAPKTKQDCILCDRRFSSTSGFKFHLKRHEGIKAFACLYCKKRFTANSNLHAHIRNVHSERKNFRCIECNKLFTTKDHLNKHQRSLHRHERAFVCGECGKSYLQRSHLNEHIAASHREDRYLCNICHCSYVSKSSLKRHQQKKHHTAQEKKT